MYLYFTTSELILLISPRLSLRFLRNARKLRFGSGRLKSPLVSFSSSRHAFWCGQLIAVRRTRSFRPPSVRPDPVGSERNTGRTHHKDWWCCRFDFVHLPHDPFLRPVGHWGPRSVSVFPLTASVPTLTRFHSTANEKGIAFTRILIISVTLVVVAVPEGLPLAVTLALVDPQERIEVVPRLQVLAIMDTFATLAFTTNPASKSLLDRTPDTRGTRLFTVDMINVTCSITEAQCLCT